MLSHKPKFVPKMMKDSQSESGLRHPTSQELFQQYAIFKRDVLKISEEDEKEKEIENQKTKSGKQKLIIINIIILFITFAAFLWGVTIINESSPPTSSQNIPKEIPTQTNNFQADATREYTILFSDWDNNNNTFKWEITNIGAGTTILTIYDPAGLNPTLPYFLQIDNDTQEVIKAATIIDCFKCKITSVYKNSKGDFTFAILNNGIYEINTKEKTKRKISFPGLTNVFDYNGRILTTIVENDLVQIDTQTNKIIFRFFLKNNPKENIKQIKFRGPNLIDLLSLNPPGIITINTILRQQERAITNLTLKKPISFIEFGTELWIYDIENKFIIILDQSGKEIKNLTAFNNVPLGDSLQSKLLRGLESELIIQDPSNNRLVFLDTKSFEIKNTIQAFGHIINGSSQSKN